MARLFPIRSSARWRILLVLVLLALGLAGVWRVDRGRALARLVAADPDRLLADPALRVVALARGRGVFATSCAACHGASARGDPRTGTPDLTDADHLYGEGSVAEIEAIVRHGIRAGDRSGWNLATMPAYASARPNDRYAIPPLSPGQINDVTQFVLGLNRHTTDSAAAVRGGRLFRSTAQCYDCHLADGGGDNGIGAPNLADRVWLYGGTPAQIRRSIAQGRNGFCPAFGKTLDATDRRAVAAFVASLAPPPPKAAS